MKRNGLVAVCSLTRLMLAALVLPGSLRAQATFVYTNNEPIGPNSVSAFSVGPAGALPPVGSPFLTGGTGHAFLSSLSGPTNRIAVTTTPGNFLYATNAQTASVPLHALIQLDAGLAQQSVEQPAPQQSHPGDVSSTPHAGKALVYVYRQGRVLGAAGYDRIFVNNEYLAALHNSNYAQREVQPGTIVFATLPRMKHVPGAILEAELMKLRKKAKERFRMEVEAGKTYYVKWSIGGKMKLMDAATGAKEMSACHPAKD